MPSLVEALRQKLGLKPKTATVQVEPWGIKAKLGGQRVASGSEFETSYDANGKPQWHGRVFSAHIASSSIVGVEGFSTETREDFSARLVGNSPDGRPVMQGEASAWSELQTRQVPVKK